MACGTVGASSDQATLIFDEESTYGTASTGTYELIDYVSESLNATTGTTTSNSITGFRRVPDISRTSQSATGSIEFEFQYQSAAVGTSEGYDLLWEAAFQSAAFATQVQVVDTDISCESIATSTSGFATLNQAAGSFVTDGFLAGQIVKVKGFTGTATNNAFCKLVSVAALEMEVIVFNDANDFVDDAAGESVTITQGPYIEDGSTCRSFTVERQYTDLSNTFEQFVGMVVDGFELSIPTEGIVTGSFSFLGSKATNPSPTTTSAAGTNLAEKNDKINSIDNVLAFTENNADFDIVAFTMTGANNLRARQQVGNLGAVSIGSGRMELTGTLQAFFADSTFFDRYLSFTQTSLNVIFQDTAGNAYVLDIPAVKLTGGQRVSGGINTDIIADMTWAAREDPTEGIVVRLARFDSADV